MKIETKYNPSDKIWTLIKNKALECPVYGVKIEKNYKGKLETSYHINIHPERFEGRPFDNFTCEIKYEWEIFATRDDLINSL